MSYSMRIGLIICICLTGVILLFSAGCEEQQQAKAIDFYIDGVMLKELGENKMAIERLNSAVKLNEHLPSAYSLLGDIYQETKDY